MWPTQDLTKYPHGFTICHRYASSCRPCPCGCAAALSTASLNKKGHFGATVWQRGNRRWLHPRPLYTLHGFPQAFDFGEDLRFALALLGNSIPVHFMAWATAMMAACATGSDMRRRKNRAMLIAQLLTQGFDLDFLLRRMSHLETMSQGEPMPLLPYSDSFEAPPQPAGGPLVDKGMGEMICATDAMLPKTDPSLAASPQPTGGPIAPGVDDDSEKPKTSGNVP